MNHESLRDDLAPYALGELSPAAADEVRAHLATCPECRALLADLSAGLVALALSAVGPAPPARSRERLLTGARATAARNHPPAFRPASVIPIAGRANWLWLPSSAALLLALCSLLLWNSNRSLRRDLDLARGTEQASLSELSRARILTEGLTSASAMRITLTSAKQRPQPSAHAMYMPQHRAFALIAENLPSVPAGKAYQLWMLPANGGAPIPSATFRPNASGSALMTLAAMPETPAVKGFALTVEPDAGSAAPTSPIVISGVGE